MAAVVAPRRENGHMIDIGQALEILDFVTERGVLGAAVLGATGEFVHYDFEERSRLAQMAVRRSRVPVIVNVSHSTMEGAVAQARAATASGAAALLLMPPYFFRYTQEALEHFYLEFIRRAGTIAPVLIYNLPFFTNALTPETACALLATGAFAGIKDSSGDKELFSALHAQREKTPFRLLLGNDVLLASHRALADGVISGCACAVPELIVAIDSAAVRNDGDALVRRGELLAAFIKHIDGFPTPYGIQLSLSLRGFPKAIPSEPLGAEAQKHGAEFREWFPEFLKVLAEECRGDN